MSPASLNNSEKKFDVVVIGAGIVGCATAYYLAKESGGKLKVGVIERNTIGSETSGGAAGMLAAQIETASPGPFLDLALAGRELFAQLVPELKSIAGADVDFVQQGIVETAFTSERERLLKERLAWQKRAGLDVEWLDAEAIARKFSFLKVRALGGLLAPRDGQVSALKLVTALGEAARKLGVQIFEHENVEPSTFMRPRIPFVQTRSSKFSADQFIFACGPWTGQFLNGAVPVEPVKGQLISFEIPADWPHKGLWQTPIYLGESSDAEPVHCYLVPKKDGTLVAGASMESAGFDRSENKLATQKILQYCFKLFPELQHFPQKSVWTGFRPGSPDGLPLIGRLPGFENAYAASGHLRNGILLGPITGRLLAQALVHGKPAIPLNAFSPERFVHEVHA